MHPEHIHLVWQPDPEDPDQGQWLCCGIFATCLTLQKILQDQWDIKVNSLIMATVVNSRKLKNSKNGRPIEEAGVTMVDLFNQLNKLMAEDSLQFFEGTTRVQFKIDYEHFDDFQAFLATCDSHCTVDAGITGRGAHSMHVLGSSNGKIVCKNSWGDRDPIVLVPGPIFDKFVNGFRLRVVDVRIREGMRSPTSWPCDLSKGLFIVTRGNLRYATDSDISGAKWSGNWKPSCMCPDGNGGAFVITRGNLRHVTDEDRDGEVWSKDWSAASWMCPDVSGGVFVISLCGNLRRVSQEDKNGQWWSGHWCPSFMCPDGTGGVFVISEGDLWHVTISNKNGQWWSGDWLPSCMCPDDSGGIFVISRGNLRHVTEADKNGQLWSQDWSASYMCPDGIGGVFAITRGNLRHATSTSKHGSLWSSNWSPSFMCSADNGIVFIISRGNLRVVHPYNKKGCLWSSNWSPSSMCTD